MDQLNEDVPDYYMDYIASDENNCIRTPHSKVKHLMNRKGKMWRDTLDYFHKIKNLSKKSSGISQFPKKIFNKFQEQFISKEEQPVDEELIQDLLQNYELMTQEIERLSEKCDSLQNENKNLNNSVYDLKFQLEKFRRENKSLKNDLESYIKNTQADINVNLQQLIENHFVKLDKEKTEKKEEIFEMSNSVKKCLKQKTKDQFQNKIKMQITPIGSFLETESTTLQIVGNENFMLYETGSYLKTILDGNFDASSEFKGLKMLKFEKEVVPLDKETFSLNRYGDILPYKENCFFLPEGSSAHAYINASKCSTPFHDDRSIIVGQGPLESTIEDFWALCMIEEVNLIVMLCMYRQKNRPQCAQYIPENQNSPLFVGRYKISLLNYEEKPNQIIERKIEILNTKDGKSHKINHLQWIGWPDYGVPAEENMDGMLYLIHKMIQAQNSDKRKILIHCSQASAGVGRSGTILAIYNISQILRSFLVSCISEKGDFDQTKFLEQKLSVFGIVRRLREDRNYMVQTPEQYNLIYQVIKKILKEVEVLSN